MGVVQIAIRQAITESGNVVVEKRDQVDTGRQCDVTVAIQIVLNPDGSPSADRRALSCPTHKRILRDEIDFRRQSRINPRVEICLVKALAQD